MSNSPDRPWLPEGALEKVTLDPRTTLVLHDGEGGMWTVAALAGLAKLFPRMAAMLKELEWVHGTCAICEARNWLEQPHEPDCRLAKLLKELP